MRTLLLVGVLAALARADATASLVADRDSVAPGGTIRVGVRFELDPHWHVYWKNPGDSGQPPGIRWKLPEGVRASGIAWPAPQRVPTPPFMTFGYEGEVTLACEIFVPAGYAQATLPIAADVDWLACDAKGCVPGEAKLSLEIPVRPGDAPARAITSGVPVPPTGPVTARYDGKRIELLAPGAPSFFFPEEPGVIEPSAPQERTAAGLLLTPVKTRKEPVTLLKGVLAFAGGPAWGVEVRVEPGEPSRSRLKWGALAGGVAVLLGTLRILAKRKKEKPS